jgi:hypothetical protein
LVLSKKNQKLHMYCSSPPNQTIMGSEVRQLRLLVTARFDLLRMNTPNINYPFRGVLRLMPRDQLLEQIHRLTNRSSRTPVFWQEGAVIIVCKVPIDSARTRYRAWHGSEDLVSSEPSISRSLIVDPPPIQIIVTDSYEFNRRRSLNPHRRRRCGRQYTLSS